MDLTDGIAGLALLVSGAALALPLLRGRCAELVVEWGSKKVDAEHDMFLRNDGQAAAHDVEIHLRRGGDDVTGQFFNSPVRLRSLAPRNRAAALVMTFPDEAAIPDEVVVTWADRRIRRQTMRTSPRPVH